MTMNLSQQDIAERGVKTMLASDQCSHSLGIELQEIRQGYAKMTMTIRQDMVNGHNICHGGMLFTLADSTFACCCNGHNRVTVASACKIDFLRPAVLGDQLTAIGTERKRGKQTGLCDVEIYNSHNQLVALFRGNSHILDQSIFKE